MEVSGSAAARTKALAAKHGFDLSGIARVDETAPRAAAFANWLARGMHGPLAYMQRTQPARERLRSRFPWAQTVLMLGKFHDAAPGTGLAAHVARYARGRDYHLAFERPLKALATALIAEKICAQTHAYTDTGPVLERAWAEAAGLGWIGKNTCLIHPRRGSYLLLAEIILDAPLAADAPALPHCGTCRRCLDACPTQALTAPGELDARRCLVTWNLERRGATPREFWDKQGRWLAGCDICQEVCPFNARPSPAAAPSEHRAWETLTLAQMIELTTDEFERCFAGSPVRRASLKGLRLNALTVAGNLRLPDCRATLERCSNDADAEIRERAQWALNGTADERG